ncbi:MAG: efflux RND transporter periplasmic adaptor subunit [Bacteroidetes bacterium]|nr:efflux RND transporter periplasmic adaptor subunit [Bacteroidota bacterium]
MKNIAILSILFAILTSCNSKPEAGNKSATTAHDNIVQLTDAQLKNAGVVIGKIEKRNISSILKVNGMIDVPPQNMVSISVPLGGYLKSTKLLVGMRIGKGETIAVMEDQQYIQLQQDYLTAKAKLIFTEAEFNRQKDLNQSKASSDKIFQQSQADYTSQKVLVKSLSEKLQLIGINSETLNENNLSRSITIASPIDGFVSKVNVNIGKYVKPEDVLFEIVNPADINLALNIFEKEINKLFIGQKLISYANNSPEKKHPCEIIFIGKDFGQDRSVEVHCHFEKQDVTLIPGMFMNAEIEVQSNNAWVLPSDAIVNFENKQYAFAVKGNNEFEMEEVNTGNTENGFTEIILNDTNGLSEKNIVSKGAYNLLMKMKNTSDE